MIPLKTSFVIRDKTVSLFLPENLDSPCPVVYFNSPMEDGNALWQSISRKGSRRFILVVINGLDWDAEMSPWPAPALDKNDSPCSGDAEYYLKFMTEEILPEVQSHVPFEITHRILAGYSLSALFAVYALYNSDLFEDVVCCSGSFWYPDFVKFAKTNKLKIKPGKMYFSLGNTEARSSNPILKTVAVNTQALVRYYKSLGIDAIFCWSSGNHFNDPYGRLAKGIRWVLGR